MSIFIETFSQQGCSLCGSITVPTAILRSPGDGTSLIVCNKCLMLGQYRLQCCVNVSPFAKAEIARKDLPLMFIKP